MALEADTGASGLIRQVQKVLGNGSPAGPFVPLLYGRKGLPELEGLPPAWLAANARQALEFVATKPKGRHKLRVRNAAVDGNGAMPDGAMIEILNDDMPFLVDSVAGELQHRGLPVRLLLHPIFKTRRDRSGRLQEITGPGDQSWNDGHQESYIAIHTKAMQDREARELADALSAILAEVRIVVADWRAMLERLTEAGRQLEMAPGSVPRDLLSELTAFVRWLAQDNFTLLGSREFELVGDASLGNLAPVEGSGLGVLRDPHIEVLRRGTELVAMTPEVRRFFFEPAPLIITKANVMARVHRRGHMDYVGVKTYRPDGSVKGEVRFVGLFTSQAYVRPPAEIPLLRHKVDGVIAASGYPPASHDGKALLNILNTFPRDELFQIGVEQLQEWCEGLLDLEFRPRVRVFARVDSYDRFVSVLLYAPRDRYNTKVRVRIGDLLAQTYNGRIAAFYPYFPEGPLVRVQFIVGRYEGETPHVEIGELERRIEAILLTWEDRLAVVIAGTGDRSEALLAKYGSAFSAGYAEIFPPERALEDIERIERLGPDQPLVIDFHRDPGAPAGRIHAAVYSLGASIRLSERVPVLENLGFSAIDERSYQIRPRFADGEREVALHDMMLETDGGAAIELQRLDKRLEAAFIAVVRSEADNDGFNRLVIGAGADWREAAGMRAYCAYLRQLGSPFGLRYLADTLASHGGLVRDLLELFHLRFDPDRKLGAEHREAAAAPVRKRIEGALAGVSSLDEDRILRQVLNLIEATVRTNFYQRDASGRLPATLAFKLDSKAVEAAPQPKPFREVWVYSPRVEGIHLRFAPIARGGIRWSDRAQDFRTEVLGLVRAQLVKNAVIVPSGAKGGFLPKQLPRGGGREEIQKEGIAAYRIFISALLDITDNIKDGKVVPPRQVVRYDSDDPYLVVAADKGTATFSDIANEISAQHNFWLGDAFASGGSAGYDHKGMAITARGAWECVKRHFREMDIDIQQQPFRVVGVGDMSGDVFGNGMLLSEHICLVAAFDHRDIFLDPHPGPGELRRAQAPVRTAALELAGLRQGQDLHGRRRILARRQVDPAERRGQGAARARRRQPHAQRADPRDPQMRDRPVVVRRHRHLPARLLRDGCRGRRPRQRSPAHHGGAGARESDRRRRQPRRHAARPHRVCRARRAHQHRLHRQLGRRQHLRPGGQHQDRRRARNQIRQARHGGPQQAAGRDDRGRRRRLAAQQLPAVAGAEPHRAAEHCRARRLRAADARARGPPPARPCAGGAAERHGAAGAGAQRARTDQAGAGGAAQLRQDRAPARSARERRSRGAAAGALAHRLLPAAAAPALRR